jgi:beta-lactamase regulating signal transducer with metallopeptidase domain
MNTVSQLLELLAKSALVLTVAALLAASWQRASAAQRHTLWLAAFVALLLLPLSKLATPHWRLPGSPKAPTVITTAAPVIADAAPNATPAIAGPAPTRAWRWPEITRLLTGVWLGGVAALLAYRLLGSVQIGRLRRRSTPLDDTRVLALARTAAAELGLADRYEIRHATAARVPCTWGLRRPVILLPTAALRWNETRLLAALRHEFGHIARRDYLTRWLGHIICALYWPNPLVWFAARSLHKAQEQACDDLVLRAGTPRARLRRAALRSRERQCSAQLPTPARGRHGPAFHA